MLLLAGLVFAGGSAAVTLGELEIGSSLGQPFAGVVRIEAAAGESIRRECFSPGPDFAAIPDVPRIDDIRFRLEQRTGENLLRIASQTPVREPLMQFVLQMRCPGLPSITRSFLVLMDPASIISASEFVPALIEPRRDAVRAASPARASTVPGGDIAPGSQYTVRVGDTLSGIASRIAGRPSYSVWPLARRMQLSNPAAFENGRPDRLIAGAILAIPTLDPRLFANAAATGRSSTARLVAGASDSQPPARGQVTTQPDSAGGLPVVTGTMLTAGGVDLDYLVLTPALSDLSRSRIRQRIATPARPPESSVAGTTQTPEDEPQAAVNAGATPVANAGWSSLWWWALLLGALTMVLALTSLFFFRLRRPVVASDADETPWDIDDAGAGGPEMVYDDFEGTFVPKNPGALNIPGRDPEDDIQTHLMPALGESRPDPVSSALESTGSDERGLPAPGADDDVFPRLPDRAPEETSGTIVETFEIEEDDNDESGWVDLDFEATQILEQDYLAEYAASLKERVKEQSGEHSVPEPLASGPEDGEVLLEASDLMETLAEESDSEDAASDLSASDESPAADFGPADDEEEALTLTLDDNVVAIDSGKKTPLGDDGSQGGSKIKGRNKKT